MRIFLALRNLRIRECFKSKTNYDHLWLRHCSTSDKMVRVLNVAEKNDAAKSIAEIMSRGGFRRRNGQSVYNKIYEFDYYLFNQRCQMIMTSVSGHLLNLEFTGSYKNWQQCNPVVLFEAPIITVCLKDYEKIKKTLESEVRNCQYLIIWTDGDREGENIGFEIIEVCQKIQPNITVLRARFSEITTQAIQRACANLAPPDKRISDAVNVRRELDLRIGAAFTRFQTLRLKRVFPDILGNQLISYGSCQFPTLGFVVERYKQVQAFIPEAFWKLKVTHKKEDTLTEFTWKRGRLFDHTACLVLYQVCLEAPTARVVDIKSRNKSKWRPQPLDTVEFEKLASRKLRINAKQAMTIAEKLYTKGYISYPRTETTIFPKELNLVSLVEMQSQDPNWGAFAQRVLEWGPNPRQGTKTDNAHPPIHPTKYIDTLQGNDKTVYDLVVRHFLACVSKDAEGRETTIEIDVNNERFAVNGLMIIARNYLEVYPYDRWNAKIVGEYALNETFQPTAIEMDEGETSAPNLLTEADLIGLMEKHGIGTDATHAEHIETIKSRLYVGLNESNRFIPGELGMGLVEGYDMMGLHMSKPHLRAELEADLKRITEGTRDPKVVLEEQVRKYKEYFIEVARQAIKLDNALSTYFNCQPGEVAQETMAPVTVPVMKCPKCQSGDITIKTKRDNKGFFLGCLSFPDCNATLWLPDSLEQISVIEEQCQECLPRIVKKVKLKFKPGSMRPFYPDELECCLGGCDTELLEILGARPITSAGNSSTTSNATRQPPSRNASSDSGYESANHSISRRNNSTNNTSSAFPVRSQSTSGVGNVPRQSTSSSGQQFPRNPFQPVPDQDNRPSAPSDDVVCNCNKKAIILTTRKEGLNQGRQFYKCPEPAGTQCDFFLWKDEENSHSTSTNIQTLPQSTYNARPQNNFPSSRTPSNQDQNENSNGTVMCRCGEAAPLLTVRKEGPNKGKKFYGCSQGMGTGCGFFQWAEEDSSSVDPFSGPAARGFDRNSAGPSHGRFGSSSKKRPAADSKGSANKQRKCGLCGQTGHDRRGCPQSR